MKKFKHKCLIAAATLALGLCLTGCGGEADTTTDAASTESVETDSADSAGTDASDKADTAESDSGTVNKSDAAENNNSVDEQSNDSEQSNTEADSSDEGTTMYTTESITLHAEASGSSEDLGVVPVGSTLIAYETYGDYIKVEFNDTDGYVLKEYVTDDKAAADEAFQASKLSSSSSDNNNIQSDKKSSGSNKSNKKSTECLDNGLLN